MEKEDNKGRIYELAFLLMLGASQDELKKTLTKHDIEIETEGGVNEIQLAYEIKKQATAQFGFYMISVKEREDEKEVLKSLTKDLNRTEGLLRFMFIAPNKEVKKKKKQKKSDADLPKEDMIPKVDRIENLSNEKLEETLEEILK